MYIFSEARSDWTPKYPFASKDIISLKSAIKQKYKKCSITFQRKFGAVLDEYGDVLGWIHKVGKVL